MQNINFAAAKQCTAYSESKTVITATNTPLTLVVTAPYAGIVVITMGETVNEAAFSGVIEGKIMVGGVQKVRTANKYASTDYPAPQTTWIGVVANGAVITFAALHTKGSNAAMVFDVNVAFMRTV